VPSPHGAFEIKNWFATTSISTSEYIYLIITNAEKVFNITTTLINCNYPNMTAFHNIMLFSVGAPLTPAGGSSWSLMFKKTCISDQNHKTLGKDYSRKLVIPSYSVRNSD